MSYKGFLITTGIISQDENGYTGLIASRPGIKIESPFSDPLNIEGMEQAIDEFLK